MTISETKNSVGVNSKQNCLIKDLLGTKKQDLVPGGTHNVNNGPILDSVIKTKMTGTFPMSLLGTAK